jgi:rod shape-determining protein MreC
VPRNRTARAAVLAGSVQRSAATPYPSRPRSVVRRRVVLGALVVLSLALITLSVRETDHGAVHSAQNAGATVLRPFQVAAERIARPFRDVYSYFNGLVDAKSENKKLKVTVQDLRREAVINADAARDLEQLRQLVEFQDSAQFPRGYRAVYTRVISIPNGPFQQQVTIAAGSNAGLRIHTPIITAAGLVGEVTRVSSRTAQVTLITDPDSAVSAFDLKTRVSGLLEHGQGDTLTLDRVTKDRFVERGDVIITAGTRNARYPDVYPRGLAVGKVTSVGQSDADLYKQIQVSPYVDFSSLDIVAALLNTSPRPAGP